MANFGFSIGDIITVGGLVWKTYKICKSAGKEYEELANEVLSLHTIVQEVEDQAILPESLVRQQQKLEILHLLLSGCEEPLKQIVNIVTQYSSLAKSKKKVQDRIAFGLEDLHDARSKLTLHASAINVFLTTLNTSALERIEKKVDELFKAALAGNRESTVLSFADENANAADMEQQWDMFRMEMMTEGFSRVELNDTRSFMQVKIRDLMHNAPELPPAERPRKTLRNIEREEDAVDDARPHPSSSKAHKSKVQLIKGPRRRIEGISKKSQNTSGKGIFLIFAECAIKSTEMGAEVDAALKSKTKSPEDLLKLERNLFNTMERLEDAFENLHQQAESLRRTFRIEAAQKLEAKVVA